MCFERFAPPTARLCSGEGLRDILACIEAAFPPVGIVLPKVETAEEVRWAGELLDEKGLGCQLHTIIETPQALTNAATIARAHPRQRSLIFGGFDMSTAMGAEMEWEPLLHARSAIVAAAAHAALDVVDAPFADLSDEAGLRRWTSRARALGMTGKVVKDPSQLAAIHEILTPDATQIERAKRIVAAFDLDPGQPLRFEGKLVELPTIKRLRQVATSRFS
ncbi:CoA ester lyase [Mesorhizobium microcysteis]|uniref:CoA ester lyase n=1 Tax=Neoaquamicrobium microcysteis TaxID=2682781 RepID=A0A5D4GYI4_9HYPH|nr:aldolase/citrate lyase family protein [Mesorhizobium microcysteis]TYR33468.1 CoA ester lyase [Mesorhizobium microcysteis]